MSPRNDFRLLLGIVLGWALWIGLLVTTALWWQGCTFAPHFDALLRINPPPPCPSPNVVLPPRT